MRVLIIDDDSSAARNIELVLKAEKIQTDLATEGEEGFDYARTYDYDAIVLDLNLEDISGLEVLRKLRRAGQMTPVIMLTASADVAVKVQAFSGGADDFIIKPFHRDEFVARIRAAARRGAGLADPVINIGELSLNLNGRTVLVNGQRVHLTGREYQLLELLALRRGKILKKDAILSALYGGEDEPGSKIIDVYICKLRRKLAVATDCAVIETVWGGGYVMHDPERFAARQPVAA